VLLLDENLSRRLLPEIEFQSPGSKHVSDLGLEGSRDIDVFKLAAQNGLAIVSKDWDFQHLSIRFGAPPKVIWLRAGNAGTNAVAALVNRSALRIRRFLGEPDSSFLVISRTPD
jgi:predicted nuclease of predicted toxin-antitoxin system